MATDLCESLMGQFRRNDADDPDRFMGALVALFAEYPPVVVQYMCSPLTGLSSRYPFVPALSEIRNECNQHFALLLARWKLDRMPPEKRARIAPRPDDRLPPPHPDNEQRRSFIAGLKAKHGENFGLGGTEEPKPKEDSAKTTTLGDLTEHYRTHGLQFQRKPIPKENSNDDE